LYTGPITVSSSETIKAIAVASGYSASPIAQATYTIVPTPASAPAFSLAGGSYVGTQTVQLATTTPGATIHYAVHGVVPTSSSTLYTGPITVSSSETIKAIAVASGYSASPIAQATYTIAKPAASAPVFALAGGSYSGAQTITLTDATPGATIYYAVHGVIPNSNSTRYTGAITVSSSETIKAIAIADGYADSAVAAATYTIQ
jgi:stage V sporulation protein SpoVS